MTSPQRILITGANGLVGQATAAKLVQQGHTVIGLGQGQRPVVEAEFLDCDVRDIHLLHALLGSRHIDSLVHCAAYSGPMVSRSNPHAIVDVNIDGTANLLEAARIHSIPRFTYLSSITVYGNTTTHGVREDHPLDATNVYAASKVSGEALVAAYRHRYGVHGTSLRISSVYGPGRTTACFVRDLLTNALLARSTDLPFGSDFSRQYIYVDDVATAVSAAATAALALASTPTTSLGARPRRWNRSRPVSQPSYPASPTP